MISAIKERPEKNSSIATRVYGGGKNFGDKPCAINAGTPVKKQMYPQVAISQLKSLSGGARYLPTPSKRIIWTSTYAAPRPPPGRSNTMVHSHSDFLRERTRWRGVSSSLTVNVATAASCSPANTPRSVTRGAAPLAAPPADGMEATIIPRITRNCARKPILNGVTESNVGGDRRFSESRMRLAMLVRQIATIAAKRQPSSGP